MIVQDRNIGGGYVRRLFKRGETVLRSGDHLTRAEIISIPGANRQALIDNGYLAVYPPAAAPLAEGELHIISRGFGKYDVIEGRVLNAAPLASKDEAEAFKAEREAGGKN